MGNTTTLAYTEIPHHLPQHVKQMLDPVRLSATLVFIASIVMVFVSAFVLGIDALVIIFAVLTYLVCVIAKHNMTGTD